MIITITIQESMLMMKIKYFFVTILLLSTKLLPGNAASNALTEPVSQCACPGETVSFFCTIIGGGTTLWKGSLFNCPSANNEVVLRHSQFSTGINGACNGGDITGQSIQVVNNCYMSQLNVRVSSGLANTTVECAYDNGASTVTIGTTSINVVTNSYSPPSNILLSDINFGEFTFSWESVDPSCQAISYVIVAEGCGTCPSTSNTTSVTCLNPPVSSTLTQCSISVQTIACGSIVGSASSPVIVNKRVLSAPVDINTVPLYNAKTGSLVNFTVNFTEPASFNISTGRSSSADSYTITLFDSNSNNTCESLTFLASIYCRDGMCSYSTFKPTCDLISFGLTLHANNVFGIGLESNPTITSTTNVFVNVTLQIQSNKDSPYIKCSFLDQNEAVSQHRWCNIMYRLCSEQQMEYKQINVSNVLQSINLTLGGVKEGVLYCYIVTASNGTFTIKLEGDFEIIGGESNIVVIAVVVSIIVLFLVIAIVTTIIIVVIIILLKRKKTEQHDNNPVKLSSKDNQINYTCINDDRRNNFRKKVVLTNCQLREFVEKEWQTTYKRGCVYYEFTNELESISERKEVILIKRSKLDNCSIDESMGDLDMYKADGELKDDGAPDFCIRKPFVGEFRVFVQSYGLGDRHIASQSVVLYYKNSSDNQVLTPVYSEHLQISQVDKACTLEQFCQTKNIPCKKCNVFPELGALKDPIAWKNVRDIILLDKNTCQYYSGPIARDLVKEYLKGDHQQLDIENKWRVFILRKHDNLNKVKTFFKQDRLKEGSFVLHEAIGSCNPKRVRVLTVPESGNNIRLSDYLRQLDVESGQACYYEVAIEQVDLSCYKDVVFLNTNHLQFQNVASVGEECETTRSGIDAFYTISDKVPAESNKGITFTSRVFVRSTKSGSRCLKTGDKILIYIPDSNSKQSIC